MKKSIQQIRLSSLSKALKIVELLALLFLFKNSILSQNLIRNSSFESFSSINCSVYDINNNVSHWSTLSSPDYYHAVCGSSVAGVTSNFAGNQMPINGDAYIGLLGFYKPSNVKEYIFQYLNAPLISGKSYYVSFFVSLADRVPYSIKNIGAYFSVSQPTTSMGYVSAVAQIENTSGYLTDTIGWTKIDGYFTAQGGEQYITIGNFNSNANTDTLKSGTTNPIPFEPDDSYYYIDSVSLYDSLDYALVTNIKKMEDMVNVKLYPNPNNGTMRLDYKLGGYAQAKLKLFDVTGKLVSKYDIVSNEGSIDISEQNLNNGIYFYHILVGEKTIKTDKIVIIK